MTRTRAWHRVYLVYNPLEGSSFVGELLDQGEGYPICTDEFAAGLYVCGDRRCTLPALCATDVRSGP